MSERWSSRDIFRTLENEIIPLYYNNRSADGLPNEWIARVKESIRTLSPQFSMRRMLKEYVTQMYLPGLQAGVAEPELLDEQD